MKKMFIATITTAIVSIASVVPAFCGNLYSTVGIVTKVNYYANDWEAVDATGNIWAFENGEDLEAGDAINLIMDDNGTSDAADDTIIAIQYLGSY